MSEIADALATRASLLNSMSGMGLSGFAGTGLREDIPRYFKKGLSKFKPIAFNALKSALSGFAKGVSESKETDLGKRALSGLSQAVKEGGISLATDVKKELGGKLEAPMQRSKPRPIIGKGTPLKRT